MEFIIEHRRWVHGPTNHGEALLSAAATAQRRRQERSAADGRPELPIAIDQRSVLSSAVPVEPGEVGESATRRPGRRTECSRCVAEACGRAGTSGRLPPRSQEVPGPRGSSLARDRLSSMLIRTPDWRASRNCTSAPSISVPICRGLTSAPRT